MARLPRGGRDERRDAVLNAVAAHPSGIRESDLTDFLGFPERRTVNIYLRELRAMGEIVKIGADWYPWASGNGYKPLIAALIQTDPTLPLEVANWLSDALNLAYRLAGRAGEAPGEAYLSMKEVAERLGLSDAGVWQAVNAGRLPAIRLGKHWRVKERDVEVYETYQMYEWRKKGPEPGLEGSRNTD